jgi:hypothetical protein
VHALAYYISNGGTAAEDVISSRFKQFTLRRARRGW